MSSPSVFSTRFHDAAVPRLDAPTVDVVVPVYDEERTLAANVQLCSSVTSEPSSPSVSAS